MNTICLDENFSTTRLLTKEKPIIEKNPDDKFETVLFLPEGETLCVKIDDKKIFRKEEIINDYLSYKSKSF